MADENKGAILILKTSQALIKLAGDKDKAKTYLLDPHSLEKHELERLEHAIEGSVDDKHAAHLAMIVLDLPGSPSSAQVKDAKHVLGLLHAVVLFSHHPTGKKQLDDEGMDSKNVSQIIQRVYELKAGESHKDGVLTTVRKILGFASVS